MISLLLDQGLPRDAAQELRSTEIDCIHVGEIGMASAEDIEIIQWAIDHGAVVVTLDADFHAILSINRMSKPSVIRIRIEGLSASPAASLIKRVVEQYSGLLQAGCMITVKRRKTTVHLLDRDLDQSS